MMVSGKKIFSKVRKTKLGKLKIILLSPAVSLKIKSPD